MAHWRVVLLVLCASVCLAAGASAQLQGPPPAMPGAGSARPDPLVASAMRWDINQDGVFTCDEWKQFLTRLFVFADKNSDGTLDSKEFQYIRDRDPMFGSADLAYFDDNRDQRVSRKEFVDRPSPFFLQYDLNRDCRVTPEELKGGGPKDAIKGPPSGMKGGRGP